MIVVRVEGTVAQSGVETETRSCCIFLLLLFIGIFTICLEEAISKLCEQLHFERRCCPVAVLQKQVTLYSLVEHVCLFFSRARLLAIFGAAVS